MPQHLQPRLCSNQAMSFLSAHPVAAFLSATAAAAMRVTTARERMSWIDCHMKAGNVEPHAEN